MKKITIVVLASLMLSACTYAKSSAERRLTNAGVRTSDKQLQVWTGACSATWRRTDHGLALSGIGAPGGRSWAFENGPPADWHVPGVTEGPAELVALTTGEHDDAGFTHKHLQVVAEYRYPQTHTRVRYHIWAYPGAPGLRAQLWLKADEGFEPADQNAEASLLTLPVKTADVERHAATYSKFNSARAGRFEQFPMMKRVVVRGAPAETERHDKAALLKLAGSGSALVLVKESPAVDSPVRTDSKLLKNMAKRGWSPYRIGGFEVTAGRVSVTGAGIAGGDLSADEWRQAYATWLVVAGPGDTAAQRAIKSFDRHRYPFVPKRDWYIGANNWGSTPNAKLGQISSKEPSMLKEIEAAGEMGIEMVQIDDGWQKGTHTSELDPEAYPQRWENVKALAKARGVELGLWQGWPQQVDIPQLIAELNDGDFAAVKLDFYNTSTFDRLQRMRDIARQIHREVKHPIVINWDITGTQSKDHGFFYGREYGNLWYENQKQHPPDHVLYFPWRVLRDAWEIAHYVNLDQVQVPIQNPDRTYAEPSDAPRHSQGYCVAIGLMGSPNFFQELKYLTPEARKEIKALLDVYKRARPDMAKGLTYPIGDRPDNASWTGFQNHDEATGVSHLLIFRERLNKESLARVKLRFYPPNTSLVITDLITGHTSTLAVDSKGQVTFTIREAPGFLFLKSESSLAFP